MTYCLFSHIQPLVYFSLFQSPVKKVFITLKVTNTIKWMAALGQNLPHQHPAECRAVISISDAGCVYVLLRNHSSLRNCFMFLEVYGAWGFDTFFLFFREEISCLKCIWHLFWSHLSLWGKWRKISAYIAFLIHHCCWHLSEITADIWCSTRSVYQHN